MSKFTDNARKCLAVAGWTEGRAIDTSAYEQANRESEFTVLEKAIEFLREFGGLQLTYPNFRAPEHDDNCHFDASMAAAGAGRGWVEDYEETIGRPLMVIGEASDGYITLCMDDEGRVYGGQEALLLKYGDSGIDAINCLVEGGEPENIEVVRPELPAARDGIELNDAARRALHEGGWIQRDVEVVPGDNAENFLTQFGGVRIRYQGRVTDSSYCLIDRIHLTDDYLRECSSYIGERVTPVGRYNESGWVLLMDRQGRVFVGLEGTPELLRLLGVSGTDAINNLFDRKYYRWTP